MYRLHYWPTPNGHKITLFLEEFGADYEIAPVNIRAGDQFKPDYLKIAPNNRMPALEDLENGVHLFESGAILLYLAEKHERFIPPASHAQGRAEVLQWLFWQMAGLGPMMGQANHFRSYAPEKIPYAIERYTNETLRLLAVMDKRLEDRPFLAGKDYSIADMAVGPWLRTVRVNYEAEAEIGMDGLANVQAYLDRFLARPAVQRGILVGAA